MTALFSPYHSKDAVLRNRIAVPPMCQYSAVDGLTNDWRQAHPPYAHWLERHRGPGQAVAQ